MSSNPPVKKILLLSANPEGTTRLRLDEEIREIKAGLRSAKYRQDFIIESAEAVRYRDIRRAVLDFEPNVVHFSGHGESEEGLVFEDEAGQVKLVDAEALAGLFALFASSVECVVLNACYSQVQAEAIAQHIPYVIGMKKGIGDKAAIEFAIGFYDGLGAGKSYDFAYKFGCNAIQLAGISEQLTPVLLQQDNTNLSVYSPPNPPTIRLEIPEGQVPLNSPFYVERPPIEGDCYQTIVTPGALIRVKAPRQMGKSSLMMRILHQAEQAGYRTAALNLQLVDDDFLSNLDQFLKWFCASIADELNLADKLDEHWQGILGSKNKCTNYLQRYLLTKLDSPLALGLDEVDQVFRHPDIASGFFGLLRAWHEKGKNEAIWQNLRLVIVHSKEVYIPLDINQSPFNVGFSVELPELTASQVEDLARQHVLDWSFAQIEPLMNMLGGHPYLIRVALYQIARGRMTLLQLLQVAPTEEGLYQDHLRRHLLNLEEDRDLLTAFKQVVTANNPIQIGSSEAFKLRSMGLVKLQSNQVMPLCELYRQYFCNRLEVI
jgi:hypothetical protein